MSDDGQPVELKIKEVEIWRQVPGDYYSPYIFSTGTDGIGIAVGGYVEVKPVRVWHEQSAQLRAETARADAAEAKLSTAEKRAERFRVALELYANPEAYKRTWRVTKVDVDKKEVSIWAGDVDEAQEWKFDEGECARAALQENWPQKKDEK